MYTVVVHCSSVLLEYFVAVLVQFQYVKIVQLPPQYSIPRNSCIVEHIVVMDGIQWYSMDKKYTVNSALLEGLTNQKEGNIENMLP